jgi:formylglycine-generating enzyme
MFARPLTRCFLVAATLAAAVAAQAVTINLVPVADPGNTADTTSYGSVAYTYQMGKFEVTAGQYCEFLNAVAATDTYGLYNGNMGEYWGCKIYQSGSAGSYTYSVASDWANRPVNYVSWGDATRFANWLSNGQPTGLQGTATTEDGSYYLNGATSTAALKSVHRKDGATWAIPNDNEWYKAACYDPGKSGGAGYWRFPTRSNALPSNGGADGYTDPGNHANYYGNDYTIGHPYYRTIVGEFEKSASAYGTFDQAGNALEWTDTVSNSNDSNHDLGGGSWNYISDWLQASNYFSMNVAQEGGDMGFRVAYVPEPGSLILLASGAAAALIWWSRRKA